MKVIAQGAEAVVYKQGNGIVKERIAKGYRVKEIDDELRLQRTKREVKCANEALRAGVNAPRVISHGKFIITMEFIKGSRVKDILNKNANDVSNEIGKALALLHSHNIIHGDPTTSNMIWNGKLYLIDFGLSEITKSIESKATDLYVLEEALKAAHFDVFDKAWRKIIKSYKKTYTDSEKVIEHLKKIKLRVRYADKT